MTNLNESGVRKPYRTSFDRVIELLETALREPSKPISHLTGAQYQAWLFGKELGFLERVGRGIALTGPGMRFLKGDHETQRRLFQSRLERIPTFSNIWNGIQQWSLEYRKEIPRTSIVQIIGSITGVTSQTMLGIYTASILNWATSAGMLERLPGVRSGVYRVVPTAKFGDIAAEQSSSQIEFPRIVDSTVGDYLDRISLLVYDVLHEPAEKERYSEELRQALSRLAKDPRVASVADINRSIIVNELNYALEVGQQRAFELVAETLRIVRRERTSQRTIADFSPEGAER